MVVSKTCHVGLTPLMGVTVICTCTCFLSANELAAAPPQQARTATENEAPAARPGRAAIDAKITMPKTVRIVDQDDRPINGATVRVGWWEDAAGEMLGRISINPPTTNEDGEVTIQVPAGAIRALISAEAPGFAQDGRQLSLQGEPVLKLKQGRIVRVHPVDADGKSVPSAFALLGGSRILGREFKADQHGVLVSPVVDLSRRWLRVVDDGGSAEALIRFSDLIDVSAYDTVEDPIPATLRPGVRLEGRLDASVPRPIKNGFIDLMIMEGEQHRIPTEKKPWQWQDTTEINPDGTFVFASLPPGGHAQLFALVDGYQSANPTEAELFEYLQGDHPQADALVDRALQRPNIWPQLTRLDQDVVQVTLPCRPTAALDVRVVNPLDQPLEGASISFSPNGFFLGGELFIPCWERSTAATVKPGRRAMFRRRTQWAQATFLRPTTDADGIARVRNLPGQGRASYSVTAENYVMPAHPTSSDPSSRGYAVVTLASGATLRRTLTMERHVPRAQRELIVVDRQGGPLSKIRITVTELTTANEPEHWQHWSVQRFGAVVSEESDENGRLLLSFPAKIGAHSVPRMRVAISGRVARDAYVNAEITLPARKDQRVICLTPSTEQPRPNAFRSVDAHYIDPAEIVNDSPARILEELTLAPNLVLLRQLLAASEFDAAEPIELKPDRNTLTWKNAPAVLKVNTGDDPRVVALCSVRPRGATWKDRPRGQSPPEAAFVFHADGSLSAMVGGGFSARGDSESVLLTNLGGTMDYFVRVSAFEEHGPFEYVSRWYRLGSEPSSALTIYHYANSNSWSGIGGDGRPIAEFGRLGYEFNGQDIEPHLPGTTSEGLWVPRLIVWDGLRNRFIGPVTQSFDDKPLYRVVVGESSEFQPLIVRDGEIVALGGRRDYRNWHHWTVVVPPSQTAAVQLVLTGAGQEQLLLARKLQAGQHNLQLQIDPARQTESESTVRVRFDRDEEENERVFTIPRLEIDERPSVSNQSVGVSGKMPVRLFDKELAVEQRALVWQVVSHDQQ